MKYVFSLAFIIFFSVSAYAYETNPFVLMIRTIQALQVDDFERFSKIFGRAALCHWGDEKGFEALKTSLPASARQMKTETSLESEGYLAKARFVGFWAYYERLYSLRVFDKSQTLLAEGRIECHLGMDATKRESDMNLPLRQYENKSCRIISFEARTFANPAPKTECAIYQQRL